MSTIQKTTLKRYNGTDWDPVYLANSADISYLGKGFAVAEGTGYTIGETVAATDAIADIMAKVINNLTTVDKVKIPGLVSGADITALAANKLTGTVARANLPVDVGGKGVEVATELAKNALTTNDVNVGDIVKVTGGKVYLVNSVTGGTITYLELTDNVSDVAWERVTNTPTTLAGYGITDAVNSNEKVTAASVANAGKILVLNAQGKLDVDVTGDAATLGGHADSYFATKSWGDTIDTAIGATAAEKASRTGLRGDVQTLQEEVRAIDGSWITTGTISIDRLPNSVIERMYVTETPETLAQVTKAQAQNGDTIKVASTGALYYVLDEDKLGTADYMDGLSEYTAGTASSVEWSGVLNKPTTLAGYGITDAVNSNEKVTTASAANAGKILTINAAGKLDASITGDAATLGGHADSYFATATDLDTLEGVVGDASSGLVKDVNDLKTTVNDASTGLVKRVGDIESTIGDDTTAGTIKCDIVNLKNGTAITALAASKLTGTVSRDNLPTDVAGRTHKVADLNAAFAALTPATAGIGDLVKCNDGKVYVIVDSSNLAAAAGYELIVDVAGTNIDWSKVQNTPTTLSGYGITDAVNSAEKVSAASAGNAGKILVLNAAGKLDVDVTGDAATLEGHNAAYFATKSWGDGVDTILGAENADKASRTGVRGDVQTLKEELRAVDASWITTGTISIDRLPHGSLERCVVVADDTARFALTTAQVQTGDTVKVTATNKMYFVVDDTKLNVEAGYEIYTAGRASAIDWSGVENTPTTLIGYGITDAVNSNEKVTTANAGNAGKILVLNAQGKLDVDVTGGADFTKLTNAPTSTAAEIDAAVGTATHTNRAVLDLLGVAGTGADAHLTYNSKNIAYVEEVEQVSLGSLKVLQTLPATATTGQLVLEEITG